MGAPLFGLVAALVVTGGDWEAGITIAPVVALILALAGRAVWVGARSRGRGKASSGTPDRAPAAPRGPQPPSEGMAPGRSDRYWRIAGLAAGLAALGLFKSCGADIARWLRH
jgi:hypothetical protein